MPKFADRLTVLKAVRARTARALDCTPGPNPPRSSQVEEDLRVRLLQLRSAVSATVLNELHLTDKIAKKLVDKFPEDAHLKPQVAKRRTSQPAMHRHRRERQRLPSPNFTRGGCPV